MNHWKGNALTAIALFLIASAMAEAADPGHGAAVIGSGTFESGNYTFPDGINITNLLEAGNTLYVDPTTNRVGIGTASPSAAFEVRGVSYFGNTLRVWNGSASNTGIIDFGQGDAYMGFNAGTWDLRRWDGVDYYTSIQLDGGNHYTILSPTEGSVGIGITSPTAKLHVQGAPTYQGTVASIALNGAGSDTNLAFEDNGAAKFLLSVDAGTGDFEMWRNTSSWSQVMEINSSSGNVGIGVTSPTHTLNVQGTTNITSDLYLSTNGLASCTGKLITDANGNITCGVDSGAGDIGANVAWTNQSNTFAAGYNQTFDTNTLFIDAENDRIGIGTTTPGAKLEVSGGSSNTIKVAGSGSAPSWQARVLIDRTNEYRGGGVWIDNSAGTEDDWFVGVPYNSGSASGGFSISYNDTQPEYITNSKLFITNTGNVGIGTTGPGAMLEIGTGGATYTNLVKIGGRIATEGAAGLLISPNIQVTPTAMTDVAGMKILPTISDNVAGNEATNYRGLYMPVPAGVGGVTNAYGLYIDAPTQGTTLNAAAIFNGSVGIGTDTPTQTLNVQGTANITSDLFLSTKGLASCTGKLITDANGNITCGIDSGAGDIGANVAWTNQSNTFAADQYITGSLSITQNLTVDGGTLTIDSTANEIGIGTTNPTATLDINGATNIEGELRGNITQSTVNIITNADFETDTNNDGTPDTWTGDYITSDTHYLNTTDYITGTRAWEFRPGWEWRRYYHALPNNATYYSNKTITINLMARVDNQSGNPLLDYGLSTDPLTYLTYNGSKGSLYLTPTWQKTNITINLPDGLTNTLYFVIEPSEMTYCDGTTCLNNYWPPDMNVTIDSLMITEGPLVVPFTPKPLEDTGTAITITPGTGNVGIGVTSPTQTLNVQGTTNITGDVYLPTRSLASCTGKLITDTNGNITCGVDSGAGDLGANLAWTNQSNTFQTGQTIDNTTAVNYYLNISDGNTPKFIIDSAGNVGIGVTDPEYLLHLGSISPILIFEDTNQADATEPYYYLQGASGTLRFGYGDRSGGGTISGATDTMTISSGNVGIGITNPQSILHIEGTSPTFRINDTATGGNSMFIQNLINTGDGNAYMRIYSGAYSAGFWNNSGTSIGGSYFSLPPPNNGLIIEGNVGIGTQNTTAKLEIQSSSGTLLNITDANTAGHGDILYANNTNIGIGTSNPSRTLHVKGIQGWINSNDQEVAYVNPTTTGTDFALKDTGGGLVIRLDGRTDANSYINNGGNFGIATSSPTQKLNVDGNANFTGDVYLPTRSLASCTGKLITDTNGNITCGVDSGAGDIGANLAWTNQSNTFAAGYNQTIDTNTLFIDAENDKIGIGTVGPNKKLEVSTGHQDGIRLVSTQAPHLEMYTTYNAGGLARNWELTTTEQDYGIQFKVSTSQGGDPTAGNTVMYLGTDGAIGIGGTNAHTTPTMTVKASGNIGINTTTPTAKLEIQDNTGTLLNITDANTAGYGDILKINNTNAVIGFQTGGGQGIDLYAEGGTSWIKHLGASNTGIQLGAANTKLVRVASDGHLNISSENGNIELGGNVGIKIDNPTQTLNVEGTANITSDLYLSTRSLANCQGKLITDTNGNITCGTDSGSGSIGTNVAYTNESNRFTTGQTIDNNTAATFYLNISDGRSPKLILDSNGELGIGTDNPSSKIHIKNGNLEIVGTSTENITKDTLRQGSIYLTGSATDIIGDGTVAPSFIASYTTLELRNLAGQNITNEEQIVIDEPTTNLVTNPSVETGTSGWSWWNNSGDNWAGRVNEDAYAGEYSLKSNVSINGQIGHYAGCTNVAAGTNYTISAWVKVTSLGQPITFYAREWNTPGCSGDNTGIGDIFTANSPTNDWIRISRTVATISTTQSLSLSWYLNNVNDVSFVDAVQIEQKEYATGYADGSLGAGYNWTGTAHASSSNRNGGILLGKPTNKTLTVYDTGDVETNTNTYLATTTGNVGIGLKSPTQKLNVDGNANFTGDVYLPTRSLASCSGKLITDSNGNITCGVDSGAGDIGGNLAWTNQTNTFQADQNITGSFSIHNTTDTFFYLNNETGRIGIGTTTPGANLHILEEGANDGKQLQIGGNANLGVNQQGYKLYIENYDNDDATPTYPIYAFDENSNVDFWLQSGTAGDNSPNSMYLRGRFGINSTTPQAKLEIQDNTGTLLNITDANTAGYGDILYANNTNIGIGTSNPSRTLHVKGIQGWINSNDQEVAYVNPTTTGTDFALKDTGGGLVIRLDGRTDANSYINNGGNFGIATSSPTQKLNVDGNANFTGDVYLPTRSLASCTGKLITDTNGNITCGVDSGAGDIGANLAWVNQSNTFVDGYNQTFDTNTLFVDAENDRVGIGTTSPLVLLEVKGQARVNNNGGYSAQYGDLDIQGNTSGNVKLSIANNDATGVAGITFVDHAPTTTAVMVYNRSTNILTIGTTGYPTGQVAFITNQSVEVMRLTQDGQIGIGTTNPTQKLNVEGDSNFTGDIYLPTRSLASCTGKLITDSTGNITCGVDSGAGDIGGNLAWTNQTNTFVLGQIIDNNTAVNYYLNISDGNTPKFIIDSSGNVGIGTTGPGEKLDVRGNVFLGSSADRYIKYYTSTNWYYTLKGEGNNFRLYDGDDTDFLKLFYASGGTTKYASVLGALNVINSGNVGIGTTNPTHTLNVNGTMNVTSDLFLSTNGLANCQGKLITDTNGNITCGIDSGAGDIGGNLAWTNQTNTFAADQYITGSLALTNNLTINTTTLVVDSSTGRVGIGTTGPTHTLNVDGTANITGDIILNQSTILNIGRKPKAVLFGNNTSMPTWDWMLSQGYLSSGTVDSSTSAADLASQDYDVYIADYYAWCLDSTSNSKAFDLWKLYGKNVITIGDDCSVGYGLYPITGSVASDGNYTSQADTPHIITRDYTDAMIGDNTDTGQTISSISDEFIVLYRDINADPNITGIIGESERGGIWFHDQTGTPGSTASGKAIVSNVISYMTGSDAEMLAHRISNLGTRNIQNGLYINQKTDSVGIATTSLPQTLNVNGTANITSDLFLSGYGLANCQGKLITDSNGNITCGTDLGGGDIGTNVAYVNQSNTFQTGQTIDNNTAITDAYLNISDGNSTKFIINPAGNVGIGISASDVPLRIKTTGADATLIKTEIGSDGYYTEWQGAGGFKVHRASGTGGDLGISIVNDDNASWSGAGGGISLQTTPDTQNNLATRLRITPSGNIGINTTTPTAKLEIQDNTGTLLNITDANTAGYGDILYVNNTNIGVGTSTPDKKLEVVGGIQLSETGGADNVELLEFMESTTEDEFVVYGDFAGTGATGNKLRIGSGISGWSNNILTLQGDGNVGINTTNPTQTLNIQGTTNITSDLYLSTNGLASCTGKLITDANGNITCGTDSGAGDIGGNLAWTNQSNTFADGYNQTIDTNTLFIDAENDKIGIGTVGPGSKLHIVSNGLGNATPTTRGDIIIQRTDIANSSSTGGIEFYTDDWNLGYGYKITPTDVDYQGNVAKLIFSYRKNSDSWTDSMTIADNNLGIGTDNPYRRLHVNSTEASYQTVIERSDSGDAGILLMSNSGATNWTIGYDTDYGFAIRNGTGLASNNNFIIDTNGKTGIGSVTPQAQLEIQTNTGTLLNITDANTAGYGDILYVNNTNIGVGTSTPDKKLEVVGGIQLSETGGADNVELLEFMESTTEDEFVVYGDFAGTGATGNKLRIGSGISGWSNNILTLQGDGNVGINTTNPTQKLNVEGDSNFTGDIYLPTRSLASCTGKLITDANGNITCGVDSGAGDIGANVAWTNQSNTFVLGQIIDNNTAVNYYLNLSDGDTPKFIIDSAGDVGIGTSNPTRPLSIYTNVSGEQEEIALINNVWATGSGSSIAFSQQYTTGNPSTYARIGHRFVIGTQDGADLYFAVKEAGSTVIWHNESLYIKNNGNVGVGTSNPTESLDVEGNFSVNNGTLFVDDINSKVGIGTTTPSTKLDVETTVNGETNLIKLKDSTNSRGDFNIGMNDNEGLYIYPETDNVGAFITFSTAEQNNSRMFINLDTGNIGIGVTSPTQTLNVNGTANITSDLYLSTNGLANCQGKLITDSNGNITCGTDSGSGSIGTNVAYTNQTNTFTTGQIIDNNTAVNYYLNISDGDTPKFIIDSNGEVGIGTDNPQGSLHIARNATPEDLIINLQPTTNLLTNPSFETGLSSWTHTTYNGGAGTSTQDTTVSLYGRYSILVAKTDTNPSSQVFDVNSISYTNGQTYTYSCWVYADTTGANIDVYDGAAWLTKYLTSNQLNKWTRLAITFTAVAGSGQTRVGIYSSTTGNAWFDGCQIENSDSISPYADGSMGPGYSWSGTPHASSSSRTAGSAFVYHTINSAEGIGAASRGSSPALKIEQDGTGPIASFSTPTSEVIRIDNIGKIGIGTTNPTEKLDIEGNFSVDNGTLFVDDLNNRVGIGTETPQQTLNAMGDANITGNAMLGDAVGEYAHIGANAYSANGLNQISPALYFFKSNEVSYGIKLQYDGSEYGTMMFGPNQANRFIGFGKINSTGAPAGDNDFGTTLMRIDLDNGNVGINTTTPTAKLEIQDNTGTLLNITDGNEGTFGDILYVNSTNVGIGTANITGPGTRLQIQGEGGTGVNGIRLTHGTEGSNWDLLVGGSGNSFPGGFAIADEGTAKLTIDSSGKIGIGTTGPTHTLNIQGSLNVTENLTLNAIPSCTGKLTTDSNGNITCSADITDTTNLAFVNNSNTFTANQTFTDSIEMTNRLYTNESISIYGDSQDLDSRYFGEFIERGWKTFGGTATRYNTSVEDAPVGSVVAETNTYTWVNSPKLPLDITQNYEVEGWMRWLGDETPGTWYFVVAEFDTNGTNIAGDGTQWHYPVSGQTPPTSWTQYRYVVGPYGGSKNHNESARYISVGWIADYSAGNGTYQFTGWRIKPMPRYPNDALTITNAGNVGINTTNPTQKLNVDGNANFTGDVYLPTRSLASCTGKLITDTNGNITCGVDSGAGDIGGNLAWLNETNTFQAEQNITGSFSVHNTTDTFFYVNNETGQIGIGTTTPRGKLDLWGQDTANPATPLASAVSQGTIILGDITGTVGSALGVTLNGASYDTYIQARNLGATSTAYNLLLQPLGGNVGIGTTTPSVKLQIGNSTSGSNDYTAKIGLGVDGALHYLEGRNHANNDDGIAIYTSTGGGAAATEKMRITGDGNIGIKTTTPSALLEINSTGSATTLNITSDTGSSILFVNDSNIGIGTAEPGTLLHINKPQDTSTAIGLTNANSGTSARTAVIIGQALTNLNYGGLEHFGTGFTTDGVRVAERTTLLGFDTGGLAVGTYSDYPVIFAQNNAEIMRISDTGNIGIGTTSPNAKLHIETTVSGETKLLKLNDSTNNRGDFNIGMNNNEGLYIYPEKDEVGAFITFSTAEQNNSRMFINLDTGNIGIGVTSPTQTLNVNGTANITSDLFLSTNGLASCTGKLITDANGNITCGVDSGAGDIGGNLAWTNQTNTFAAGYNQTIDTDTLFIDAENDKIGIGTTTPGAKLDVRGTAQLNVMPSYQTEGNITIGRSDGTLRAHMISANNDATASANYLRFGVHNGTYDGVNNYAVDVLTLRGDETVGIGTTNPYAKLTIKQATANDYLAGINLQRSTTADTWSMVTGGDNNLYVGYATTASGADATSDFATKLLIDTTGQVGIGTASPNAKLHIGSGDLHVESGDVQFNGTGDNVGIYYNQTIGKLGIGTTQPASTLEINGTLKEIRLSENTGVYRTVLWQNSTEGALWAGASAGLNNLRIHADGDLIFEDYHSNSNIEIARLKNTGLLGIKTPDPYRSLHVNSTEANYQTVIERSDSGDAGILLMSNSGATNWTIGYDTDYGFAIRNGTGLANDNPFIIDSNGKTGIGSVTPQAQLEIQDTNITLLNITDGNTGGHGDILYVNNTHVGIGTSTPQVKLDVADQIRSMSPGAGGAILDSRNAWSGNLIGGAYYNGSTYVHSLGGRGAARIYFSTDANSSKQFFAFQTGAENPNVDEAVTWYEHMRIVNDGSVGIGTNAPTQTLNVQGNANITSDLYLSAYGLRSCSGKLTTDTNGNITCSVDTGDPNIAYINQSNTFTTGQAIDNTSTVTFYLNISDGKTPKFIIDPTGQVGIGVATPTSKLEIDGNITILNGATIGAPQASSGNYGPDLYIKAGDGTDESSESTPGGNLYLDGGDYYDSSTSPGGVYIGSRHNGSVVIGSSLRVSGSYPGINDMVNFNNEAPAANNNTARIYFSNKNSGGNQQDTSAIGGVLADTSTSSIKGELAFYTLNSSLPFSERMRINYLGDVGIGTDSPKARLHIESDRSTATLQISSVTNTSSTMLIQTRGASNLQGANPPTTTDSDAAVGTVAWTNPGNAITSDNNYATAVLGDTIQSQYLNATSFGFTIPNGSIILGIEMKIEAKASAVTAIADSGGVYLNKGGGAVGSNKGGTQQLTTSDTPHIYGGVNDLWGTTWTAEDINKPTFGVLWSLINFDVVSQTASVDSINITVYYESPWSIGSDYYDNGKLKIAAGDQINLSSYLTIDPNGFVGINTSSPTQALSVDGTANITGGGGREGVVVNENGQVIIGKPDTPTNSSMFLTVSGGDINVTGSVYYHGALVPSSPFVIDSVDHEPVPICMRNSMGVWVGCLPDENNNWDCKSNDECNKKVVHIEAGRDLREQGYNSEEADKKVEELMKNIKEEQDADNIKTKAKDLGINIESAFDNIRTPGDQEKKPKEETKEENNAEQTQIATNNINKEEVEKNITEVKENVEELKTEIELLREEIKTLKENMNKNNEQKTQPTEQLNNNQTEINETTQQEGMAENNEKQNSQEGSTQNNENNQTEEPVNETTQNEENQIELNETTPQEKITLENKETQNITENQSSVANIINKESDNTTNASLAETLLPMITTFLSLV